MSSGTLVLLKRTIDKAGNVCGVEGTIDEAWNVNSVKGKNQWIMAR